MKIINSILSVLLLVLYGYFAYLLYDIGLLSGKIEIICFKYLSLEIYYSLMYSRFNNFL